MRNSVILALAASIGCLCTAAQTINTPAKPSAAQHTSGPTAKDGQRVFEQNCSRCHNPPDGFPRSISMTVVRHMRVRASLSDEDMKALKKFLVP